MRPTDWGWGFEGQECAEGRFCRALRPTRVPSRARAPARLGRGPGVRRKTARPALFLWWGRSAWCVQAERWGAPRRGGRSMRKKRKPALRVTAGRGGVFCLAGGATRKRPFRGFSMDGEKSACGPRQRAGKRDPTRLLMVTVSVPLTAPGVSGYASSQNFPREEKKRWENQVEAKAAGAVRGVVRAGTGPQPRAIRRAAGAATLLPKGPNAGGLVATSSPPDRRSTGGRA